MKTPSFRDLTCTKIRGGKRPIWHARLDKFDLDQLGNLALSSTSIKGAGNSADNAIRDFQAQFRRLAKKA